VTEGAWTHRKPRVSLSGIALHSWALSAEGIEGVEQEAALLSSGCDQGQGQLFSCAVSGRETMNLFAGENTVSL
jgi:sensor c-di-GMP phosphodiesterase-like protein